MPNRRSRMKRPFTQNIGLFIFIIILIYILLVTISFFTSKRTEVYEVRRGTLTANKVYRGIAIRDEEIYTSNYSGYINFYNKEGDRLGVGSLAYTIDENGELKNDISDTDEEENLYITADDLAGFRNDIIDYTSEFTPANFSYVYNFKNSISSAAQKVANRSMLDSIENIDATSIHQCDATETGDIVYSIDGYEDLTFADLAADDFNESKYQRQQIENNQYVNEEDPVYKLSTNENWSVAIRVDSESEAQELVKLEYVRVRFLKNQQEIWASVSSRSDSEGNYYVDLSFSNSMVNFCADRFIDLEVITEEETGLKVPNTSLKEEDFFVVPKDYVTTGSSGQRGVLLKVYTDDNKNTGTEFVSSVPYSATDDSYYLDDSILRENEVIVNPETGEEYILNKQEKLTGVYYINKGYADFRQVNIIYQNDEYSIVEPDSQYGLLEYDYIVRYADTIDPDEFVNQ